MKLSYDSLNEFTKTSRMHAILVSLSKGYALCVDDLYLEEVKFIKQEYGDDLVKSQGRIYRININ